jgi:hypothetical protein
MLVFQELQMVLTQAITELLALVCILEVVEAVLAQQAATLVNLALVIPVLIE